MFEDLLNKRGLSLERLHTLILLAESGSLISAASGDHARQSRLSHHLQELSEFFGVELTVRAGKTIQLSAAGKELADLARDHLRSFEAFKNRTTAVTTSFRIAAGDSLSQWLLVPALGRLRRGRQPISVTIKNWRSSEIVPHLRDREVEFGLLRADAVEKPLEKSVICDQRYAIFVPQRLVPSRGLNLKDALFKCPHAAFRNDGQLVERLRTLAESLGGTYSPELICDSIGQCVGAIQTGAFAAVLPVNAWTGANGECLVVEDDSLDKLRRRIVLAWHPRTLDLIGNAAEEMRRSLITALKEEGKDWAG